MEEIFKSMRIRADGPSRRPLRKRPRGITFLEILVVMVILALLVALVAPNFLGQAEKAKANTTRTQIRSLDTALKMYRLHNSIYPTTEQGLEALLRKPEVGRVPEQWQGPYLSSNNLPADGWKNPFLYLSDGTQFTIISLGADGQEGGGDLDADITNQDL